MILKMCDSKFDNHIQTQILHVNFGAVENGQTSVKIIKFVNKTDIEQSYEIQRDPLTNPIDYVFTVKEHLWILAPGCEYACYLTYQPFVTFCKNTDYFTIIDSDGNECFKIVAKGVCIGPKVAISKKKLIFYFSKEMETVKKQIQVKNMSKVPAIFQLDHLDKEQCPFKLTLTSGTIEPSSFIYINISFIPFTPGIHVSYLPLLLLNQKPIIIELYGYFGLEYSNEIEFQQKVLSSPLPRLEGYEDYMSNVSNIRRTDPPLISLSRNYIDFGQASIGYENCTRRSPQTVCFYNHSSINVLVVWEKVASNVFKINPLDAEVSDKNSSIFEISFDPLEENSLYCHEILLSVFRKQEKAFLAIPLIIPLRIIGHSFREGSKKPIPHYKIPQTVLMPTCCPTYPVYTTFLIRKLESQYPLMFRFFPPEVSHFIVKPMLGIIYKDYQIVTVEMFPDTESEHLYYERWAIQFNDCQKSEDYIDFKGYTEYLNLRFEVENCISFDPTFPGCCQFHEVSVRNVTRHCIKYSFLHLPKEIKIQYDKDIINPNESIIQQWFFSPSKIGDYNFTVGCKLIAVDVETMETTDSPNKIIEINVLGISERGTLIATPNELNFEELAVRDSKSLSFQLFNFSRVVVHFKMFWKHLNWPIGCLERDLKISPIIGTIFPQENRKINIKLTPHEEEFYEFFIQYFVRPDPNSENLTLNDEPKNICKVNCKSVYPTFIVKDLLYFGTGPGVSKVSLWKLMAINKLNKILQDLKPNSNSVLQMTFPVFTVHEEPLRIQLLIMNPMTIPVSWSLKRVKLCSCEKKFKSKSLSFQSVTYDCAHREICKFYPKSGTIKSRGEERLSLEIRYHLLGTTELQWELILNENRRVNLKGNLRCVSEDTDELVFFFQEAPLQFDKVYIGDFNPIHQMCWIYNSTKRELFYFLDTEALNKINEKFGGEIFTCINPSGSLKGLSHQPIIFKYHPRQFQEYSIKIPITLGKKETEVILKGESSRNPITKVVERISPYQDKFLIPEVPVYFNTDSLTISPISTQSTITRMIMIHNRHPKDMLEYSWESYEVPQIIKASMHPSKGRIQPLKMQTFLLTVFAGSRPSKITISLTCKFINVSERRLYEKELLSSCYTLKQLENDFTITEKGIYYPKDTLRNLESLNPSIPFYKGLTIRAYIYSTEDYDMKASLEQKLKLAPTKEIKLHSIKRKTILSQDNLNVSGFILECMIWDILNSREFQYLMKEVTLNPTDIKYSQIVMDATKRKELIKKSYIKPPKKLIEKMVQKMIFTIVHEEYMLDTNHLVQPSDIRQLRYTKISAGVQMDHINRSSN